MAKGATQKKVQTFNLAEPDHRTEYEELLNDPAVVYIIEQHINDSNRTGFPIITVW